jgi:hypothetical protein
MLMTLTQNRWARAAGIAILTAVAVAAAAWIAGDPNWTLVGLIAAAVAVGLFVAAGRPRRAR